MERCFIVSKESKLYKDLDQYRQLEKSQIQFINKFFKEHEIESEMFRVSGNGMVNQPFNENCKSDIKLSIIPTKNDIDKYGKYLSKPDKHDLCSFKKNSKVANDFAQKCVDEKVIINLYRPRVGDYFKSISYHGCNTGYFELDDKFYLRVKSDFLKEDDTPEGFTEILKSEYYKAQEEMESKER